MIGVVAATAILLSTGTAASARAISCVAPPSLQQVIEGTTSFGPLTTSYGLIEVQEVTSITGGVVVNADVLATIRSPRVPRSVEFASGRDPMGSAIPMADAQPGDTLVVPLNEPRADDRYPISVCSGVLQVDEHEARIFAAAGERVAVAPLDPSGVESENETVLGVAAVALVALATAIIGFARRRRS